MPLKVWLLFLLRYSPLFLLIYDTSLPLKLISSSCLSYGEADLPLMLLSLWFSALKASSSSTYWVFTWLTSSLNCLILFLCIPSFCSNSLIYNFNPLFSLFSYTLVLINSSIFSSFSSTSYWSRLLISSKSLIVLFKSCRSFYCSSL